MSPRIGSLFSGVGGLDIAVEAFFGGETVWHCEFDPEPSKVLAARWPGVPNLGDITTVDWATVEPVDILIGGFPCQDLSLAGRRSGMRPGTRSGLWADFKDAIRALSPSFVVIENVRGLLSGCAESESDSELGPCPRCVDPDSGVPHAPNVRALGRVLGDLADLGFDAEWCGLPASSVGAPHGRFRVFVLAYARGVRLGDGWDAVAREAAEWGASAVAGGRSHAPLTLLPTPSAMSPNEAEDIDAWQARRARVKAETGNGNGFGMPLDVAVRLLPTPEGADASGGRISAEKGGQRPSGAKRSVPLATAIHHGVTLMPTPQVADATGGHASRSGDRSNELLLPGLAREMATTWGEYEPAVRLWEHLTRPAPDPTRPDGKNGAHRLSSRFPEWMMGYLDGWVTDILTRNPAIKACGNGVVPQQAYAALGILWPRVIEAVAA